LICMENRENYGKVKISVIIPVYNVEQYIEECLKSIFQQIDSSFEIICIDDGSTDASGAICDKYSERYTNCRVIHTENKGPAATRNEGLRVAQGEYIAFVDSDDYVAEEWANAILTTITEQQCDMLVFDYCRLENTKKYRRTYGGKAGYLDKIEFLQDVVIDRKIQSQLWQKVFRRKLFDNIIFPEKYKCLEDYAIFHLLIEKADTVYYLNKILYFYRIRLERNTMAIKLQPFYDSYLIAKERYLYLTSKGLKVKPIGIYIQILLFCTYYWGAEVLEREKYKQEYYKLKEIINQNVKAVITDEGLDIKFKVKYLIIYLNMERYLALYTRYGILGSLKRSL